MMKYFKWIWCLPQILVGALVALFSGAKWDSKEKLFRWKRDDGLSLDFFIFVSANASENTKNHERGHTKQSRMLGPLYLFTVGICSFIWSAFFVDYRIKHKVSYYDFWCEKWADELGGVKR